MPATNDELHEAVNKFWQEMDPPGGMAIRWTLTIEGIDDEGDRWLDFVWSDDLKTWELKGMLHAALDSQIATEVVNEMGED